ncbi:MAG: hypothetical protein FJ388_14380, partial [Verrucomicrobia bacterium]|nr:hypothetical protein [Verrucomicrobiota bacterium]
LQPTLGGGQDLALTLTQQAVARARAGLAESARATLGRLERDFGKTRRVIGGVEQNVVEFARQRLGEAGRAVEAVEIPKLFAPTPRWAAPIEDALSGQIAVTGRYALVRSVSEIRCVDLSAGKRLWQARAPLHAAADAVEALRVSAAGRGDRVAIDVARHAPQIAAGIVYTVENSPGYGRHMDLGGIPGAGPGRLPVAKFGNSSQLVARDMETGKTIWRVGRGEGNDDFVRAARWVSAPTIVNGRLFAIALHVQSYHLVCLDAADGRLVWRAFICQRPEMGPGWSGAGDLDRASPPCVALGRVLCLTNAGVLACFDQFTGEPSWFRPYGVATTDSRTALIRAVTARSGMTVNAIHGAGGIAVMAPADWEELMAVEVATGRLCWSASREGRQQLVGLTPGDAASGATARVVMAGPGVAAHALADGKPVWNLALDGVTGRPLLHGTTLCVLSRNRGIIQLDARNGRELACSPLAIGETQHLALGGTTVLMTATKTLTALADFREAFDELTRQVEAHPDDARPLRQRGELNLRVGRLKEALDDLTLARAQGRLAKTADPATDALLFRCHMELAARDPDQAPVLLEKSALCATTPARRSERWLRLGENRAARKLWSGACEAWQMILDTETEAWLDLPESRTAPGNWLAGGRVSNRAQAASSIELLVRKQGLSAHARAESAARQRLTAALKRNDTLGLVELTRRYPVGETQERAWLALAEREFAAQQYDQAADTLSQFLRAQPAAGHKADAALGLALAGVRGDRLGLARHGLALLEAADPKTRAHFANVTATAQEMGRLLQHETPAVRAAEPSARPAASRGSRSEIPVTAVGGAFSGRLFFDRGQVVRADPG